jgi:hypothetical protein
LSARNRPEQVDYTPLLRMSKMCEGIAGLLLRERNTF